MLRGVRKRVQRLSEDLEEPYHSVFPFTQQHIVKQRNLVRLARELDERGVEGVVVECGVLDGGSAALMAWATSESGRHVHLFDSWEGLPDPTAEDGEASLKWAGQVVGSPYRVRKIMTKLGVDATRLHFHKGWFEDTFPDAPIDQVALLHVDCDLYEPVLLSLRHWYPRIAPGGFIQIDDYGAFRGCDLAVGEFLAEHPTLTLDSAGDDVKAFYIDVPRLTA